MSFESEIEKNTQMKTTHIHRNKLGLNEPRGLRQPLTSTRNAGTVQGTVPARKTQPKNHQGSRRSAMGVKKRAKCSRTKKNCRKSLSRCAASAMPGHGNTQEQRHSDLKMQLAPRRKITRAQAVNHENRGGDCGGDQTLGQYAQARASPGKHHPATLSRLCVLRQQKTREACRHPKRQAHIQGHQLT